MNRAHLLETSTFNQLARVRDGYLLYNLHDIYIGQSIEAYGEFSRLELDVLEQIVGPGDIVIEVGANIGAHTIPLARRVGPMGRVIAFEPQRIVFQTLCANVAINSLTNIDCHWAAVGRAPGTLVVPEPDPNVRDNFGGVSLLGATTGRSVEVMTLDSFLTLPTVTLLKIDVEGMESEVLAGGARLLETFKPVLYLENDRREKSESLIRQIQSLGYNLYWHLPPLFNANNFYGNAEDKYPRIVSVNMIGVHHASGIRLDGFLPVTDPAFHPMR